MKSHGEIQVTRIVSSASASMSSIEEFELPKANIARVLKQAVGITFNVSAVS